MHMINLCMWPGQAHFFEFKESNHVLKVTLGQIGVQLCLWKSFATVLSLATNFLKCRKLWTITHICDNGDHSALWTTGPQGRWKKMHLFIFICNPNRERAAQWEFRDSSFLEPIRLKNKNFPNTVLYYIQELLDNYEEHYWIIQDQMQHDIVPEKCPCYICLFLNQHPPVLHLPH